MKPRTLFVLLILTVLLGSTAQVSAAKVSLAVSRREEFVFVPLNNRITSVELARVYNTGEAPLELTLTWTKTWGNLDGVLSPDAFILNPNETRLCYLVFNASAMGGLDGVMEVKVVQDEFVLNGLGAGGKVVPAFEIRKSVTVAESPVLAVELQASPIGNLAILVILNVGLEPVDDLLTWRVEVPEWLRLSKIDGFGPASVEVALAPELAPGSYEGELLVESNVGSERLPITVIVEEPVVEEPEPPAPEENTTIPEENTTIPIPPEEPEPEPEPSMNWTPVLMVGLLAVGVFTALKRKRGSDDGDYDGDKEEENEVFGELKRRTRNGTGRKDEEKDSDS